MTYIRTHGRSHAEFHVYEGYDQPVWKPLMVTPCIPLFVTGRSGCAVLRDGYLMLILRDSRTGDVATANAWFPEAVGPYGTWQWIGRITTPAASRLQFVGFGEESPVQYKDSIQIHHNGVNYYLDTYKNNVLTSTILAGQDWTVDRTFKLEWALNFARLSVDGVVVATHITNVPDVPLVIFMEIMHNAAQASHTYVRTKDWQQLA